MQTSTPLILSTDGSGLWSDKIADIRIQEIVIVDLDEDDTFGSLHAVFDTQDWNTEKDGLIYTDKQFLADLCRYLEKQGINITDIGYSEQGRQGDNFVDFDISEGFIKSAADLVEEYKLDINGQ